MINAILIGVSVILIVSGYLWLRKLNAPQTRTDVDYAKAGTTRDEHGDQKADETQTGSNRAESDALQAKRSKRKKTIATLTAAVGAFLLLTRLIDIIFGPPHSESIHFSLWPERVELFGMSVSVTIVYSWLAMVILIIAAIIVRFAAFSRPEDPPTGLQNVIETIVEAVGNYTNAQAHGTGEMLCSYILSIGSFLVMCAVLELFRLRAPTSDITITFSMAIMTFVLINIYGIKRKGTLGRIKALASPTPVVFPFRLISEIAIPVSLACRLFGNMLGGMIVVDLLYTALGNNAVGIPGVLGLYFNAFHPLIQAFIFITLTLTFINEAIE